MGGKAGVRRIAIKDLPLYTENPFKERLSRCGDIRPVRVEAKENMDLINKETGQVFKTKAGNGKFYFDWHDTGVFTKLFAESIDVIRNLKNPGTQLFYCILKELPPNRDMVHVDFRAFSDFSGIKSRVSYYEAIMELVGKQVIALVKIPCFYINPVYFFNGQRKNLLGDAEEAYDEQMRLNKGKISNS